jgi:hypothetical protein
MENEQQQPDDSTTALVTRWTEDVKNAKEFFGKRFKQMRSDASFAAGKQWPEGVDDNYIANITLRHLKQAVASLYAKNPKASFRRRDTLEYTLWDGDPQSLATHMQAAQMGDPNAIATLMELDQVKQKRVMMDRLGKTMVILFNYYLNEPIPTFKTSAKQMIRRVKTCGVGYVKLGFQRAMGKSPDVARRLADSTRRLDVLERMAADLQEGEIFEGEAEYAELQLAMQALQQEPDLIIREGLVFDFPSSTAIIPDPDCYSVKGWLGARWVAQEFMFTANEIQETYGYDVKDGGGTEFNYPYRKAGGRKHRNRDAKYQVFEIYDRDTGTQFTVCDGCKDFLEPPAPPKVKVEQFIPIYGLVFNELDEAEETDQNLFPISDVTMLRPMQEEHNRSREALRQHRIANRPGYVGAAGILAEDDKGKLATHAESEFIELQIPSSMSVEQVLQRKPTVPIDGAVYDTSPFFEDMQRVVGSQAANSGQVMGGSATEVSVAEGSRMNDVAADTDELDEFLSLLARESGGIMLREISPETAKKIAGPGAVWPELTGTEIAEELFLEIRAGSSGRPNKAADLANLERVAPFVMQSPGLNPPWWLKQLLTRMDETIEIEDAVIDGLPSLNALNAQQGRGGNGNGGEQPTGDPASDPNQQGNQGATNAQNPRENEPGPQPQYPTA